MKRYITLFCGLMIAQPALAQTAFEKAEKRIADLVAPGSGVMLGGSVAQPVQWKASRAVENMDLPITPYVGFPARLPPTPIKAIKPRSAPEGTPLVFFQDKTKTPKQVELPTKPLIKLPSVDVNTPLPIPILAQPAKDRASLNDPAFEASLGAAMKPFTPKRDRPVPFVPYNLPDPFENVRYGQLRNPPEESATPPVIPLQKPTK
jgi:hypothetical protein